MWGESSENCENNCQCSGLITENFKINSGNNATKRKQETAFANNYKLKMNPHSLDFTSPIPSPKATPSKRRILGEIQNFKSSPVIDRLKNSPIDKSPKSPKVKSPMVISPLASLASPILNSPIIATHSPITRFRTSKITKIFEERTRFKMENKENEVFNCTEYKNESYTSYKERSYLKFDLEETARDFSFGERFQAGRERQQSWSSTKLDFTDAIPAKSDLVPEQGQDLDDLESLQDLEAEFDNETFEHCTKYEIISTDSPNVISRGRSTSRKICSRNFEFGAPLADSEPSTSFNRPATRMLTFDDEDFEFTSPAVKKTLSVKKSLKFSETPTGERSDISLGERSDSTPTHERSDLRSLGERSDSTPTHDRNDLKTLRERSDSNTETSPRTHGRDPNIGTSRRQADERSDSTPTHIRTLSERSDSNIGTSRRQADELSDSTPTHIRTLSERSDSNIGTSRRQADERSDSTPSHIRTLSERSDSNIGTSRRQADERSDSTPTHIRTLSERSDSNIGTSRRQADERSDSTPAHVRTLSERSDSNIGRTLTHEPSDSSIGSMSSSPLHRIFTSESTASMESGFVSEMEEPFLDMDESNSPKIANFSDLLSGQIKQSVITGFMRRPLARSSSFHPESKGRVSLVSVLESPSEEKRKREDENAYSFGQGSNKRRRSNCEGIAERAQRPVLQRAFSENNATIKSALARSSVNSDLIGDYSGGYALPLTSGDHKDLKSISCDTLASLLRGEFRDTVADYQVIDCRYPYEFEGGHIDTAVNVFTPEQVQNLVERPLADKTVLIFHCEFSIERGPKLSRTLRSFDRSHNRARYPSLAYPELYLLHGGYRAFHRAHPSLCTPGGYTPMLDPQHKHLLRRHRSLQGRNRLLL